MADITCGEKYFAGLYIIFLSCMILKNMHDVVDFTLFLCRIAA